MKLEKQILETLKSGHPLVLATILSQAGSTPRTAGTRMAIKKDGTIFGTIGGGKVEAEVMQTAAAVLETNRPKLAYYDLTTQDAAKTMDMICGGQLSVLMEPIHPNPGTLSLFAAVVDCLMEGRKGWMVAHLGSGETLPDRITRCLITNDGKVQGDFTPPDETQSIAYLLTGKHDAENRTPSVIDVAGSRYLVEPCFIPGTVYLFGGGHVSQQVAKIARMVDFRVVVLDDRAEFANQERFPDADQIHVIPDFKNAFDSLTMDPDSFLVILTRGHAHDRTVLEGALKTNAGYIGMIGSRKKRNAIYKKLLEDGFTQEDIDRVHSPIGLPIGAETPEEIGVSIAAELILERAKTPPIGNSLTA